MDWVEFMGKSVNEALTKALIKFGTTSDKVEYEVIEKESNGILGLFSKPAKIRVRILFNIVDIARTFLDKVLREMRLNANVDVDYNEEEGILNINIIGDDMGVLIGKRGQTLDSLQYLTNLAVNKESERYLKVKLDTENYRERRKETLEKLAKNIAYKVKKTKCQVLLEPMNPYERRIIHSVLQNDKYIETHSEGQDPYRHVIITLKKEYKDYNRNSRNGFEREYKKKYSGKFVGVKEKETE